MLRLHFHKDSDAPRIVDGAEDVIAIRIGGSWVDPFGGTFTIADVDAFDALLAEGDYCDGDHHGGACDDCQRSYGPHAYPCNH